MMRSGALYILLATLAPAVIAAAAPKAMPNAGRKLIQSCDAHKFETVVDVIVDGQPHQSKVKLCGVEGQSDAEWLDTLRDAIRKVEANKDMPAGQRTQIVTAIRAEIARLSIVAGGPALPPSSRQVAVVETQPLSRDYATLPPLPLPTDAPPVPRNTSSADAAPSPVAQTSVAIRQDAQQPFPAPTSAAGGDRMPATTVPVAATAPRLRFGCDTPGDLSSDAPCADFERETMITVHAGDDVPAGTLLQFVRNNDPRAEVALGGLRRGGTLRIALPAKVCTGFTSGKLELRILDQNGNGAPQPLGSEGPYALRC